MLIRRGCWVAFILLLCGCSPFGGDLPSRGSVSSPVAVQGGGALPPPSPSTTFPYPRTSAFVSYVIDGDTIVVVLSGEEKRVRYIGMDTPEREDPYYTEATEANKKLVYQQEVWLEKDVSEVDQYGRLLRYVYTLDAVMVNESLVCSGFAVVFTFPPDVRYADRFVECQKTARSAGLGLWGLGG
jgi:micrococcal nuclease